MNKIKKGDQVIVIAGKDKVSWALFLKVLMTVQSYSWKALTKLKKQLSPIKCERRRRFKNQINAYSSSNVMVYDG